MLPDAFIDGGKYAYKMVIAGPGKQEMKDRRENTYDDGPNDLIAQKMTVMVARQVVHG